jgi:peroxiredoxin
MGEQDGSAEDGSPRSGAGSQRGGAGVSLPVTWMAGAAVLLAGLALILFGEEVPDPITRGSEAPDFELSTLSEDQRVGLSQLRGQVVLLNFWATWCKPCEDELPSMEQLYRVLGRGREGFELLAVSVDESPKPVQAFREQYSISFPILLDPEQRVSRLYQTRGFPESLLIDRQGRVVERYVGPRDWVAYRERILELVREGRGGGPATPQ